MPYLYLVLAVFGISSSSIFGALFNRKTADKADSTALFNVLFIVAAACGWALLLIKDFSFDGSVLRFSVPMGVCYSTAIVAHLLAMKEGSISLTSLFLQLSLIAVTIWGFFFWGEKVTVLSIVGLLLAVGALMLCLWEKKEKGENKKITVKWILLVIVLFVSNAACTIIQRTQQMVYDGKHANSFMLFSMLFAFTVVAVRYLKSNKADSKAIVKSAGIIPIVSGVCNAALNLFLILLATSSIPPSLIYPVVSVGGLAVSLLASALLFKERLYPWQWAGVALGALSVVFLSV